jgi:hypothetical protein
VSVSRRNFFKLIGAGAAVAFLPIPALEEVAQVVPKPEHLTLVSNSLWRVVETTLWAHPNEPLCCDLTLIRESDGTRCEISMYVKDNPPVRFGDVVQMELRYEGRVAVVDVGGEVLNDQIKELSVEFPPSPMHADLIVDTAEKTGTKLVWGPA